MNEQLKKVLVIALLVIIAALSAFPVADMLSSNEANAEVAASIDEKVSTVLKLTSSSTLVSAGISAIPGDTATPIAEKLADFSQYFLLILCVLYTEKFLLSVIGLAAFRILIPCACILAIISIFRLPKLLGKLAVKIFIFALALYIVIPLSIKVSDKVYDSFDASINNTLASAQDFTDDTSELVEAEDNASIIDSLLEKLSETTSGLSKKAADVLNNFMETLAIMIVTSCVIPILGLIFFIWVIKLLTGLDFFEYVSKRKRRGAAAAAASEVHNE